MKGIRFLIVCILVFSVSLLFASCSVSNYSRDYECAKLTDELIDTVLTEQEYSAYLDYDLKYIIKDSSLFDSYSVIYSSSSDDVSEVGILRAKSKESLQELLNQATEYIEELKKEKRTFVENYLPEELEKINSAKARCIGNYVVFTVLESEKSESVFSHLEALLSS